MYEEILALVHAQDQLPYICSRMTMFGMVAAALSLATLLPSANCLPLSLKGTAILVLINVYLKDR